MQNPYDDSFVGVIACDVRSVYNVGSFFRTADAAGVSKLFLTGITPSPQDRFGRMREDVQKTALGAQENVPWEYHADIKVLIPNLKKAGVACIALEQDARSVSYKDYTPQKPYVLIVGNEPDGLSQEVIDMCDEVVEIPMMGAKESLNVSVALGVVLFQYLL